MQNKQPIFSNKKGKQIGFTLIEILVVLVLIGIAVGGATAMIDVGGGEKDLTKAVSEFSVFSDHASEMAVITGEPIGLVLESPEWQAEALENSEEKIEFDIEELGWQYRWMKETGVPGANGFVRRWLPIEDVETVRLPPEIKISVTIDNRVLTWEKRPEEIVPIVAFYPGGEVTPFEIEFLNDDDPDTAQHVVVNVWGEVEWKEKAEAQKTEDDDF